MQVRQVAGTATVSEASEQLRFSLKTSAPDPRITGIGRNNQITATTKRRTIKGLQADPLTDVELFSGRTQLGSTTSNSSGQFSYTLTPDNIEKLGQGTGKRIRASQIDGAGNTGSSSNETFQINTTRGSDRRDLLTGERKSRDTFRWRQLQHSPVKRYDTVTNYESMDRLRIRGSRYRTTLENSEGRIKKLNRKQINQLLGKRDFVADSTAAFQVRGMGGTFIAFNDGRPGFQANRDGLVFLEGFSLGGANTVTVL